MIGRSKCFLLSFAAAFFLLSLIMMSAVLWIKPVSRPQLDPAPSTVPYLPQAEDSLTILVSGLSLEEDPQFFILLSLQPHRGKIPFTIFPPSLSLSVENPKTLAELYHSGGICQVQEGLSSCLSIPIDRWAEISGADFQGLIDQFEPASLSLPQAFRYSQGDVCVTLQPGLQSIDGAKAQHLLSAPWKHTQQQRTFLEELIESWLGQYLKAAATAQSQSYFQHTIDRMQTDISILDYSDLHPMLEFLAQLSQKPVICYRISEDMRTAQSCTLMEKDVHLLSKVFDP